MTDTNTAEKPKLSVIPKGHWRNVWRLVMPKDEYEDLHEITFVGSDTYLSDDKFVSREMAEQDALGPWPDDEFWNDQYLGPVFFPD